LAACRRSARHRRPHTRRPYGTETSVTARRTIVLSNGRMESDCCGLLLGMGNLGYKLGLRLYRRVAEMR
jgi:hypothetical protein